MRRQRNMTWSFREKFGDGGVHVNLLGMGSERLPTPLRFSPGTEAVNERERRVVANYAEHSTTGKSWRVTMTAPFINRSHQILYHGWRQGQGRAGS